MSDQPTSGKPNLADQKEPKAKTERKTSSETSGRESLTYKAMLTEVEGVVRTVSDPELDLDAMVGQIERGYALIKTMRERLDEVKAKVEQLRLEFE